MPYYTFEHEYCIPEDRNIPIQDFRIRLVYNGWNHFTPFFPWCVAEVFRKGEPILRKISHALDGLKQLSALVPKKCLLKSGLISMIEHLEATDTVGKSYNFKFGTAETELTEDVALPHDDTIVTGHSRKHSLPLEKGCEPSPKKSAPDTRTSETVTAAEIVTTGETSMTVTTTTMATAESQMTMRSQTAVASTSTAGTSTDPASKDPASTGTGDAPDAPQLAHRKSIKLPALQCVCGKIFERELQLLGESCGKRQRIWLCVCYHW